MVNVPIKPATYAQIRKAAARFVLSGSGIVPNDNADFEEPIYGIANQCFGFKKDTEALEAELQALRLSHEDHERIDSLITTIYDTALTVGYMFGAAVGLQMATGPTGAKDRTR